MTRTLKARSNTGQKTSSDLPMGSKHDSFSTFGSACIVGKLELHPNLDQSCEVGQCYKFSPPDFITVPALARRD